MLDRQADQRLGIQDSLRVLRSTPRLYLRRPVFDVMDLMPDEEVALWSLGISQCGGAGRDLHIFIAAVAWLADAERRADPEATEVQVTAEALLSHLRKVVADAKPVDVQKVGLLLHHEPPGRTSQAFSGSGTSWRVTLARGIRPYRDITSWQDYLTIAPTQPGAFGLPVKTSPQVGSEGHRTGEDTGSLPATADEPPEARTVVYDIAFSYAGEDEAYVRRVAEYLRVQGIRCFFAPFETPGLWGSNLAEEFDTIFRRQARYVVIFISQHYVTKPWPRHEWGSAQARQLFEDRTFVLPVRLDDTELPGLRPTTAYVDARSTSEQELAELILAKLRDTPEQSQQSFASIPSSPAQQARLLTTRPDGWEYLLFAGHIRQRWDALEPKWRDHVMRYVKPGSTPLTSGSEVAEFLGAALTRAQYFAGNVERIMAPEIQEAAFGPPGTPGDPDWIEHFATRIVDLYENFLDWALEIRSAQVPDGFQTALEAAAAIADQPIREVREFLDDVITRLGDVPRVLREYDEKQLELGFTLILTVDDAAIKRYEKELKKARRRYG